MVREAGVSDGRLSMAKLVAADNGEPSRVSLDAAAGLPKRLFNHIRLTGPDSAWIATEEGGLYRFEDCRIHGLRRHYAAG